MYRNVVVNVYHGQAPLLTIYDGERYEGESLVESRDKWTVTETHFLHEYESKEDINDMMLERGFSLLTEEELEEIRQQKEEAEEKKRLEEKERRDARKKKEEAAKAKTAKLNARMAAAAERNKRRDEIKRMMSEKEADARASSDSAASTAPSRSDVENEAYPNGSTEKSGEEDLGTEGSADELEEDREEVEDSCGESSGADGGEGSVAENIDEEEKNSADIRLKSADIPRREELDEGSDEL